MTFYSAYSFKQFWNRQYQIARNSGNVVVTQVGGHWLDYHRRQQEKSKKKLKKQYSKIIDSPEIASIVAPFSDSTADIPPFDTLNLDLLYENKAALQALQKAIEQKLMLERLARELKQRHEMKLQQDAEDDELLLHIAKMI